MTGQAHVVPLPIRGYQGYQDGQEREQLASYLASSPGARARTREGAALAGMVAAYRDYLGRASCPPSVMAEMAEMIRQGLGPDVLTLALAAAADAPRPSWAYARAVATRCLAEGVITAEAFRARSDRHRAQHGGQQQQPQQQPDNPALRYSQRTYPPGYFDSFFEPLL